MMSPTQTPMSGKAMILNNMFPGSSKNDCTYLRLAKSKHSSYFPLGNIFYSVHFSYFFYVSFYYFRSSIFNAKAMPGLEHFIFIILFGCPHPEMFWINAWRIVTGMTNAKTFWNFSIFKLPNYTMRQSVSFLRSIFEESIPILIKISLPNPTAICFSNVFKKSFFFRNFHALILTYGKVR